MTMSGRTREAFRHLRAVEDAGTEAAAARARTEQVSLLGRTLVAETTERLPRSQNGITLSPILQKANTQLFREATDSDAEFPLSLLRLFATGDQISGWMNYTLKLIKEDVNFEEEIAGFGASSDGHFQGLGHVDTHLVIDGEEGRVPVEFEGPDYQFVRAVSGLFMPQILKIVPAESPSV